MSKRAAAEAGGAGRKAAKVADAYGSAAEGAFYERLFAFEAAHPEYADRTDLRGPREVEEEGSLGAKKALTAADMARVRIVFLTPARCKALNKEAKAHDRLRDTCGGDTEWGNKVIAMTLRKVKAAIALPAAGRFDALFALTHTLAEGTLWMSDNELWEGKGSKLEKAVRGLAAAWKDLLAKGNKALGIDPEYSRPGVEYLLEDFADRLTMSEAAADIPFNWREPVAG
jgi:hypothetical protein